MENKKIYTEEKLYKDGLQLLENGHRMAYIFKYVRDRASSDEMRQQVMERLNGNPLVQQVNKSRVDQVEEGKGISWLNLAMLIFLIVFMVYVIKVVLSSGRIPILPIVVIIAAGIGLLRNKF